MRRALLALALLAPMLPFLAIGAQRGVVTVGADPAVYDAVAAGAAAWTATGYVEFVVEPSGCGTGDLTVCVVWWEPGGHLACHNCAGWGRIDVDGFDLARFGAADACHEIGHYLGLGYHRSDGASCMSEPAGTAYPDATDLANLGWAPPTEPEPDNGTFRTWPVITLPSTGVGTAAPTARAGR